MTLERKVERIEDTYKENSEASDSTSPSFVDAVNANIIAKSGYALTAAGALGFAADYLLGSNDPVSLEIAAVAATSLGYFNLGATQGGRSTHQAMKKVHNWKKTHGEKSLVEDCYPKMADSIWPCTRMGAEAQIKKEGLEDKVRQYSSKTQRTSKKHLP